MSFTPRQHWHLLTFPVSITVSKQRSPLCHPIPMSREVQPPNPLVSHPNCLQAASSYPPLFFHSLYPITSSQDHLYSSHNRKWKQGSASYHTANKQQTSSYRRTQERCWQLHQPSGGWAASPGGYLQHCP